MTNPFRYRPTGDPDDGETDEWADNWFSNALAWASQVFTPAWCDTPDHWTSRVLDQIFTSCPCCLFFRGLVIGGAIGIIVSTIVSLAM